MFVFRKQGKNFQVLTRTRLKFLLKLGLDQRVRPLKFGDPATIRGAGNDLFVKTDSDQQRRLVAKYGNI